MDYSQYIKGKSIQTGYQWTLVITISAPDATIFPTTATFVSQIRESEDGPVLAELTSANSQIVRIDNNTIELRLPGAITADWTVNKVVLDIVRTDLSVPQHLEFDMHIPVKRSITRI